MEKQSVLTRLDHIRDLPTLPVIAMEVNKLFLKDDITIERLSRTLEKDPAITAKILKLVNSAFFGLPARIGSISEAVLLLGFNSVRNAVISASIIQAFSGTTCLKDFNITDFWRHSLSVAMVAKALAEKSRFKTADECFLAGLLHDIGKIVLSQFFPDLFRAVWQYAHQNNLTFHAAEQAKEMLLHADIGGYLAGKWQFPHELVEAITLHHNIPEGKCGNELLCTTHAADLIVHAYLDENCDLQFLQDIHPAAATQMRKAIATLSEWLPVVKNGINDSMEFFFS